MNEDSLQRPQISICVCTYKRPQMLATLLQSLALQTHTGGSIEINVVDNDSTGSAQEVVAAFCLRHPLLNIHYAIEPTQGISYARNHSVRMARGEFIAFVDDDECASATWLQELMNSLLEYRADAVFGPVIPTFPDRTPYWVISSNFFIKKRFPHGQVIPKYAGATCNALIHAHWAKTRTPTPFALSLAHTGGEDTDFFSWVHQQGGKLVWCDTALVTEDVPPSRQTLKFMLERSLRTSINYWRTCYLGYSVGERLTKALVGFLGGLFLLILGVVLIPFGFGHAVRAWVKGTKALGRVGALGQIQMIGYKK